jgi:hypothetical protein
VGARVFRPPAIGSEEGPRGRAGAVVLPLNKRAHANNPFNTRDRPT